MNLIETRWTTLATLPPELRWFGDPVLRAPALPLTDPHEIQALSADLARVLGTIRAQTGLGRAIAAPQIGVLRRMFVAYDLDTDRYLTYVNPVITAKSAEHGRYQEMCLSGMPLAATVIRPWEIEMDYLDLNGTSHRETLDPMRSRIAQHEIDHLDGILFTDRADPKTIGFEFDWATLRQRNVLSKVEDSAWT
ncbi:MAG: peptide deformylase [Anaerolineae bacterium]|jgi:peptide deformylase|nr:peptide deformylase [Anaerolineae bacterium]